MNKPSVTKVRDKYILSAIETLQLPKSGDITKWVNDELKSYIEKKYSASEYLFTPAGELAAESKGSERFQH